ncbi:glycosyltransferase [Massilia niastensis]|uniref:glycosyltransferase n=1 Tax=Massilia niastensis TaxID=544911 RepID=UPI00035F1A96|nr:glycosyltransferase [Massilia niastensis]
MSFSKHLPRHDWEPLVLSAHPRAYTRQNPSQLSSVPANLVVRRAFALDTKRHLGFGGRYSELMALPDRWISWWGHGVVAGLRLIRQHKPRVIWSTFPIATAHLIGLTLHRLSGLPWIADFRDPMLQPTHPESPRQRGIYGWLEKQTLRNCTYAVFTTQSALNSCKARYPKINANKFRLIENGYDEDEFARLADATVDAPALAPAPDQRVTLLHSGVLYSDGRDPEPFMAALASLKEAGSIDAASLRVSLRAPGNIAGITAMVARHGLDDIVDVLPPVPYREALNEMLAADGLLVFQGTPFNNQIPAKVYEYFRARKPILGLVDPVGETATVLRNAGFANIAAPDQKDTILDTLERFIPAVRDGQAYFASDEVIARAARTHKAGQLADLFDEAVR